MNKKTQQPQQTIIKQPLATKTTQHNTNPVTQTQHKRQRKETL